MGHIKLEVRKERGLLIFYALTWVRAEGRGREKVGSLYGKVLRRSGVGSDGVRGEEL